jgi:hypothetical protein
MIRLELLTALTALASLSMVAVTHAADDIEGPQYDVIASANGVELRQYAPYIVAEVTVDAPSRDAASSMGFRPLAGYIFGGNTARDEIAMTAPVTTQASGTKIAMTAPVTTEAAGQGTYTVQFTMPRKWTMETLPVPNDPSVNLREIPAETRLAYRFVGPRSQDSIDAADRAVMMYAADGDLAVSTPIVAGYDGPRTPPAKRRWEVQRVVK